VSDASEARSAESPRGVVIAVRQPQVGDFLAFNLRRQGLPVDRVTHDPGEAALPGAQREPVLIGYVETAEDAGFFEEAIRLSGSRVSLGLVDRQAPAGVLSRARAVCTSILPLPIPPEALAEQVRELLRAEPRALAVDPVRGRTTTSGVSGVGPPSVRAPARSEGDETSRVPPELRSFLSATHPRTLLIKGRPGTGKTTLALAVLEQAPAPGYYIANRVAIASLLDYHPTVRERLPREHVLDSGEFRRLVTGSEVWNSAVDLLLLERDPLERRTAREERSLPPAIHELLARLSADSDSTPPVVVVDSWEALGRTLLSRGASASPARDSDGSIEEAFLRLVRDAGSHLVFVLETEDESPLDYFADGIVTLERELFHDRLFRRIRFDKLRGTSTQSSVRPFTLERGRFRSLEPPPTPGPVVSSRPPRWAPRTATEGTLSWGNETADRFLGPLVPGGSYLWENESSAPMRVLQGLAGAPILQALAQGWRVVILPSLIGAPASYPTELATLMPPDLARRSRENLYLLPQDARRFLDSLDPSGRDAVRSEARATVPGDVSPNPEESGVLEAILGACRPKTHFTASLLGLHAASGLEGEALTTFATRWITRVHQSGAILTLGVPSGHPSLPALEYRTLGHYRWWVVQGTLLLAGEKPFTPLFAVEPDDEAGGFPVCRLVPVA
jgi:KaiC/GvpD/RAD55 family RecA-like ATPase